MKLEKFRRFEVGKEYVIVKGRHYDDECDEIDGSVFSCEYAGDKHVILLSTEPREIVVSHPDGNDTDWRRVSRSQRRWGVLNEEMIFSSQRAAEVTLLAYKENSEGEEKFFVLELEIEE